MEMTMEEIKERNRLMRKDLRRRFSTIGWILLIYYGIMNVAVVVGAMFQAAITLLSSVGSMGMEEMDDVIFSSLTSGWGYVLAVAVGMLILLLWKKPAYFKNEIFARGKPMSFQSFLGLMFIFISGQTILQIAAMAMEMVLNAFGLSMLEGMQAVSMDTSDFSMFLYGGILAPITEEILFRGLIQRTLMPYGKRFAIFCSAFTFGIFHGNLIQSPYAFLVGLVLGYVASEYSIVWAMVLHMINNLVLGDMLNRLTSGLPEMASGLLFWAILLTSGIVALVLLIVKRHEIRAYRWVNPINRVYLRSFFASLGIILLMIFMAGNMLLTFATMITPL